MRTRRFRPVLGFRPAAEILLPRIAPSDITLMMYLNTDTGTTTPTDPGTAPDCPVYTGPSVDDPAGGPAVQANSMTTTMVGS
jgi:hypothetical protein